MSAKDDFELIGNAVGLAGYGAQSDRYAKAYERLFTPRPLRALVAEGHAYAWVYDDDDKEWMMWTHKMPHATVAWSDLPAIPILTPDDMGVK